MGEIITLLKFFLDTVQTHGIMTAIVIGVTIVSYTLINKKIIHNKQKKHAESLQQRKKVDSLLKSTLNSILNKLGASRAMICEYHNGGCNLSGLSFLHISVTAEVTTYRTPTVSEKYTNIMASRLREVIDEVEEKGMVYIEDLNNVGDSYQFLQDTLLPVGVQQVILLPIEGIPSPLGLVIIGINDDKVINDETLRSIIIPDIQRISHALDYSKK